MFLIVGSAVCVTLAIWLSYVRIFPNKETRAKIRKSKVLSIVFPAIGIIIVTHVLMAASMTIVLVIAVSYLIMEFSWTTKHVAHMTKESKPFQIMCPPTHQDSIFKRR